MFNPALYTGRNPVGETLTSTDVDLLAQIAGRRLTRRHQFIRIFVAQFVERKRALLRDVDGFFKRLGRIEVRQPQTGAQMLFRVWCEIVAAFSDRLAKTDCRQGVLQRLARADMQADIAGGNHRQAGLLHDLFNHRAMLIVARLEQQGQRDPGATGTGLLQPLRLPQKVFLGDAMLWCQQYKAIGHAAQMRVFFIGIGKVGRREAIRAFLCARACECDQFAQIAVALAIFGKDQQ